MTAIHLPQQERPETIEQALERFRRGPVADGDVVGGVAAGEGLEVAQACVLEGVRGERSLAGTVFENPEVVRGIVRHTAGCQLRALLLATRDEARSSAFCREAAMCDQVWVGDAVSATLVKNRIGTIGAEVTA